MKVTINRFQFMVLFAMLYAFRTFFGLSKLFYGDSDINRDAFQTYLIGLKFYTTHNWPYFGPDQYDQTTGFHFQIAGALEGLMVGLPFWIWHIPEAPFLFLNLLSLSALALLAWYLSRKFQNLSMTFIFIWLSLMPWTLNQSTHVFNVSYLLSGSVVFFLGFFEAVPEFSIQWLSPAWAFALMGFGLFWDMQFHQSWILLAPFMAGAWIWRRKSRLNSKGELMGFILGSILPFDCLLPTLIQYGFLKPTGGLAHAATLFNFDNFKMGATILARYFSLPSFEMPRFMGGSTVERWAFLLQIPFVIPAAFFLTLVGWIQPFILLLYPFLAGLIRVHRLSGYPWIKWEKNHSVVRLYLLVVLGFFLIWVCFWFATTGPSAHMYYVLLPMVAAYSFAVWDKLALKPLWKGLAIACVFASVWFQAGMAGELITSDSLYNDRDRIVQAIRQKDYQLLGDRRPWVTY
jgi:hypothetical protein